MDDTKFEFGCTFAADGRLHDSSEFMASILGAHEIVFDAVVSRDRLRLMQAITAPDAVGTSFDIRWKDPTGRVRVLGSQLSVVQSIDEAGQIFKLRVREVTELRRLNGVLHSYREVLDQIATDAPIATALDAIARMVEASSPDAIVAIYLRRDDAYDLAAAPSAPTSYFESAATLIVPEGFPVRGTIEPIAGPLAEAAAGVGLGFGWWLSVIDEDGTDVAKVVALSGEKRFLSSDERLQCDEAARLIAVAVGSAVTARVAREANTADQLTGLLNRKALMAEIEPTALDLVALMIEVPGLLRCNREFGFVCGDTLLLAVAERLRRAVRNRDFVGRWSGTRFVVVGHNHHGGTIDEHFYSRMRETVSGKVMVGGALVDPGSRVSWVAQIPDETPTEMLLRLESSPVTSWDKVGNIGDVVGM